MQKKITKICKKGLKIYRYRYILISRGQERPKKMEDKKL